MMIEPHVYLNATTARLLHRRWKGCRQGTAELGRSFAIAGASHFQLHRAGSKVAF